MPHLASSTISENSLPARLARASKNVMLFGLLAFTPVTFVTSAAGAQTPAPAQHDSLVARLEDMQAQLDMLRQQMGEAAGAGVHSRSRVGVELSGRILMNVFSNDKETNNADVPMYRKQVPVGSLKGGTGMAIRQTSFGIAVTHPEVWGGQFTGDLDVDFFGGQFHSTGGRTFPLIRLRTARAIVDWEHSQLLIGQEMPLISGLNPVSLAAVGVPEFTYAGNLWFWIPQIRYGVHTTGSWRVGLQGAVLAPTSGDTVGNFLTTYDRAERTNVPYAQARVHFSWGDAETGGEIGFGVHSGAVMDDSNDTRGSSALAADWLIPIGSRFEIRGEAYTGELIRGLGGGAINQNFGIDGITPVSTTAAWTQLNYRLTNTLRIGAGYGFDDPDDDDLAPTGTRFLNTITSMHAHWRPAGPLVFGIEMRTMKTRYDLSDYPNRHINLAFGFEF
jgi:hypothetical protein